MIKLTDWQRMRIVTRSGALLGHLREIRAHGFASRTRDKTGEVYALVYGRLGWLERFGLRTGVVETRDWSDVERIVGRDIIVADVPGGRRTGSMSGGTRSGARAMRHKR